MTLLRARPLSVVYTEGGLVLEIRKYPEMNELTQNIVNTGLQ